MGSNTSIELPNIFGFKFIKTIDLRDRCGDFSKIPLGDQFLNEVPATMNYEIKTSVSVYQMCIVRKFMGTFNKHEATKISVRDHCCVHDLTESCVLGFTSEMIEKYAELFTSDSYIIHPYDEIVNLY